MSVNHCSRFFKKIQTLNETLQTLDTWPKHNVEDDVDIWVCQSHDHEEKDCFRRDDGLWESYCESYGRKRRKFIFIWRYHPNYCCAGRPIYSAADRAQFLEKSETEKVMYTHDDYEFVWAWNEIFGPTHICWGMCPAGHNYFLRKNGVRLTEPTKIKKEFRRLVANIMPEKE